MPRCGGLCLPLRPASQSVGRRAPSGDRRPRVQWMHLTLLRRQALFWTLPRFSTQARTLERTRGHRCLPRLRQGETAPETRASRLRAEEPDTPREPPRSLSITRVQLCGAAGCCVSVCEMQAAARLARSRAAAASSCTCKRMQPQRRLAGAQVRRREVGLLCRCAAGGPPSAHRAYACCAELCTARPEKNGGAKSPGRARASAGTSTRRPRSRRAWVAMAHPLHAPFTLWAMVRIGAVSPAGRGGSRLAKEDGSQSWLARRARPPSPGQPEARRRRPHQVSQVKKWTEAMQPLAKMTTVRRASAMGGR